MISQIRITHIKMPIIIVPAPIPASKVSSPTDSLFISGSFSGLRNSFVDFGNGLSREDFLSSSLNPNSSFYITLTHGLSGIFLKTFGTNLSSS